jgi:hypothetical protein
MATPMPTMEAMFSCRPLLALLRAALHQRVDAHALFDVQRAHALGAWNLWPDSDSMSAPAPSRRWG